jgi:restriction system protein
MVRAGRGGIYADDFLNNNMVAIGWDLGPNSLTLSKPQLDKLYRSTYPSSSDGQVKNAVVQIDTFLHRFEVGNQVITYDRERRRYLLGIIRSAPVYKPDNIEDLSIIRDVEWTHKVSKDTLQLETRNSLGAIQTVFQIRGDIADDVLANAVSLEHQTQEVLTKPTKRDVEQAQVVEEQVRAELLEKAEEAIEDRIVRLDWEEMQELVAGILRAMGYKTDISPRGSDRGVDIFASPDGLGLEEPRIFVEVKHRPNQSMGSQDVRSFLGGRVEGDRCLYVSTGGFTKDARYEADRAKTGVRLLTLVDLRRLLVENYEKLDEEIRSLVPLKRIYVLAA